MEQLKLNWKLSWDLTDFSNSNNWKVLKVCPESSESSLWRGKRGKRKKILRKNTKGHQRQSTVRSIRMLTNFCTATKGITEERICSLQRLRQHIQSLIKWPMIIPLSSWLLNRHHSTSLFGQFWSCLWSAEREKERRKLKHVEQVTSNHEIIGDEWIFESEFGRWTQLRDLSLIEILYPSESLQDSEHEPASWTSFNANRMMFEACWNHVQSTWEISL